MTNIYLKTLKNKCPQCSEGHLFNGYLSLYPKCTNCGFDTSQIKADDGPSYLTILIVGHLLAPFMHFYYTNYKPEPIEFAMILCSIGIILSLVLLPIFKRLIYAFMYQKKIQDS